MSLILIATHPFENEPLNKLKMELVRKILQMLKQDQPGIKKLDDFIKMTSDSNLARAPEHFDRISHWFKEPPIRIPGDHPSEGDLDRLLYATQRGIVRIINSSNEARARGAFKISRNRHEDYISRKRELLRSVRGPAPAGEPQDDLLQDLGIGIDTEEGEAKSLFTRFVAEYGEVSLLDPKGAFLVEVGTKLHQNGYTRAKVAQKLRDYGEKISNVSKSNNPNSLWTVVGAWEDKFSPKDFFGVSTDMQEATVLEELGNNLGRLVRARDAAELEGFKRLANNTIVSLFALKKNRYVRYALGHADTTAKKQGYTTKGSGARNRIYERAGTVISIIIDEDNNQIGWSIQRPAEKAEVGSEKVNPSNLRSVGWAIAKIFESEVPEDPMSDREKKQVRRSLSRPARVAAAGFIIALTSAALLVYFRKRVYRYSKTLYYKFKLLLDDWHRKGWIPGKKLTTRQRLELIAFLQGMSVEELRASIHATKDIKPLKPVEKGE